MERYESVFGPALKQIRTGRIEIDPFLSGKQIDLRLGLSAIIRPPLAIRRKITDFLESLQRLEPDQYYYSSDQIHLTFLPLVSATPQHEEFLKRAAEYEHAATCAFKRLRAFSLNFTGVTASPSAVMVQGFTSDEALNRARDELRSELHRRGLTEQLDVYYRLETAHVTIVRFKQALRDGERFASVLENSRHIKFGEFTVDGCELVTNDCYLSLQNLVALRNYRFADPV